MEKIETYSREFCIIRSLEQSNVNGFSLKPKQVTCFGYLLEVQDVLAVLPTSYRKSLLFHLLPDLLPVQVLSWFAP